MGAMDYAQKLFKTLKFAKTMVFQPGRRDYERYGQYAKQGGIRKNRSFKIGCWHYVRYVHM